MKITLNRLASFRILNKTWASLGAALVIGVLAALAARSVLGNRVGAIKSRFASETVEVVVARDPIRQGSPLSRQGLAIRKMPAEYAQSGAVRPQEFYRIEGRSAGFDIRRGDTIMWSHVKSQRTPTFSDRLTSGQRAITVVVDEFNSVAGTLQPGDMVDLMYSTERGGRRVVVALLQGIPVMATGQRLVDNPASGVTNRLATLTLNTTPEQARQLIIAGETGSLTALLRNPHDRRPIAGASLDPSALRDAPRPARPTVPVLYGDAVQPGRNRLPGAR